MKVKSALLTKLGQNIRKQREVCGLSQESLAFEAGLDRTYIGGPESQHRLLQGLYFVSFNAGGARGRTGQMGGD